MRLAKQTWSLFWIKSVHLTQQRNTWLKATIETVEKRVKYV